MFLEPFLDQFSKDQSQNTVLCSQPDTDQRSLRTLQLRRIKTVTSTGPYRSPRYGPERMSLVGTD